MTEIKFKIFGESCFFINFNFGNKEIYWKLKNLYILSLYKK